MKLIEVEDKDGIAEVTTGLLLEEYETKDHLNVLIGHGNLVENFLELISELVEDQQLSNDEITLYMLNYTDTKIEEDIFYNTLKEKFSNLEFKRPESVNENIDVVVSQLQPNGAISLKYDGFTFEDEMQTINNNDIKEEELILTLNNNNVVDYGYTNILKANRILLMTQGKESAPTLKEIFEGFESTEIPATNLFVHKDTTIICDSDAIQLLE